MPLKSTQFVLNISSYKHTVIMSTYTDILVPLSYLYGYMSQHIPEQAVYS